MFAGIYVNLILVTHILFFQKPYLKKKFIIVDLQCSVSKALLLLIKVLLEISFSKTMCQEHTKKLFVLNHLSKANKI